MQAGDVVLLENLRFHKEETENDREFSRSLANLGEIYVNDRTKDEDLEVGKIYKAKVTDFVGNILTATVDNA